MLETDKKVQILDFEKPIYIMQEKIEELKKISMDTNMNYNSEIETLEKQTEEYTKELYENLEPYQ